MLEVLVFCQYPRCMLSSRVIHYILNETYFNAAKSGLRRIHPIKEAGSSRLSFTCLTRHIKNKTRGLSLTSPAQLDRRFQLCADYIWQMSQKRKNWLDKEWSAFAKALLWKSRHSWGCWLSWYWMPPTFPLPVRQRGGGPATICPQKPIRNQSCHRPWQCNSSVGGFECCAVPNLRGWFFDWFIQVC